MNAAYILMSLMSLLLVVFAWFWTSLMAKTLPFGVRIPPDRIDEPIIQHVYRDYYTGLIVILLLVEAAGWFFATSYNSLPIATTGGIFVTLLLIYLDFYSARRRIAQAKKSGNWYAGLRQVVMADISSNQQPAHISLLWFIPAFIILIAMIIVAIVRYPVLPQQLPTHFGIDGQPNRWTDKLVALWTLPLPAIFTTALLFGLARYIPQARQQVDPANPEADVAYQHELRHRTSQILPLLATMINLILLVISMITFGILPTSNVNAVVPVLMVMLLIVIIGIMVYLTRTITLRNQRQTRTQPNTKFVAQDDDRYWIAGMFYYNPDDPALWIEKRMGIGWTVNLGNPWGKVFIISVVAIILVSIGMRALVR
ncbi:membrane protein [Dictyobacter vulcani]|uniref:Membrane protein n=1 Tax=Dictyobacter vulcani TaxID=2607529 RepID=A0A5J4KD85_9CHLR|nr:DUF1648 domain-containing protein [Dictyobacter vulcani]GER86944.1 membrane protein [Dictyobacter vulcani]